jgi:hypothetical protein
VPGGGFVLIYSDITERKRLGEEICAARDAAGRTYSFDRIVVIATDDFIVPLKPKELALAIASDFDLKIINAAPRGRTAPRWRGLEGSILLEFVDEYRRAYPHRSVQWCLERLQRDFPKGYGQMPRRQLGVRYHEAKRYRDATK